MTDETDREPERPATDMRICFTAFVFGDYKRFIPVFCYSLVKSYPEYSVKIFVDGNLNDDEWDDINALKAHYPGSIYVEERAFEGMPLPSSRIRAGPKMFLRWLFEEHDFEGFDGVYFSDIDFLVLRHNPPFGDFHVANAHRLGLPFGNMVRVNKKDPSRCSERLSGLHFVISKPYFSATAPLVREFKQDPRLIAESVPDASTNEHFLFHLVMNSIPFDWKQLCDAPRPSPGLNLAWAHNPRRLIDRVDRLRKQVHETGPLSSDAKDQLQGFSDDPLFLRILWNGKVPEAALLLSYLGVRPTRVPARWKFLLLLLRAKIDQWWQNAKGKTGLGRRPRYTEG